MNVFVLCTGRCGSLTFAKACEHITNYTVGHESRNGLLGEDRLSCFDQHIEVDNRLVWFLGRLDRAFGRHAFYVHLTRDAEAVARSFAKRTAGSRHLLLHYRNGIVRTASNDHLSIARDYVETVSANIDLFLKDKPNRLDMRLETIGESFPVFWDRIGARGDLPKALEEFETRHNAS